MAASSFIQTGTGVNPMEAFSKLVKMAILDEGDDSYNGTISTTILVDNGKEVNVSYTEERKKKAFIYAREKGLNLVTKRECACIDCGIKDENTNEHVYVFYGFAAS